MRVTIEYLDEHGTRTARVIDTGAAADLETTREVPERIKQIVTDAAFAEHAAWSRKLFREEIL